MLQLLLEALKYTVIGVGIVFAALIIIMYGIKLVSAIVVNLEGKSSQPKPQTAPVVVEASQPEIVEQPVLDGVSPEVVAAITAAITIIMSDASYGATPLSFRVKKIKRI